MKKPTLFDAACAILGPIAAVAPHTLEGGDAKTPLYVEAGCFRVEMTLGDFQRLNTAYMAEFYRQEKRDDNKAKRDDLIARIERAA